MRESAQSWENISSHLKGQRLNDEMDDDQFAAVVRALRRKCVGLTCVGVSHPQGGVCASVCMCICSTTSPDQISS